MKYLGYIFFNSNFSYDAEMLRQMRLLYCTSNCLVRLFSIVNVAKLFLLSGVEVFAQRFTVPIFGPNTKKLNFLNFVLHITTYIIKYYDSVD